MTTTARPLAALLSGSIFGFGLALSSMVDPTVVRAFLDVTGDWDPRLGFVLAGAVPVAALGYLLSLRFGRPAFDDRFHLPAKTKIDGPLVLGAAIFGAGWGMAGFCPGPAVAALSLGLPPVAVFVAAMVAGMLIHRWMFVEDRAAARAAPVRRGSVARHTGGVADDG
jgi:uncharacterized membrane protein YedE/YeeE